MKPAARLAWIGLFALIFAAGMLYSLVQPLGLSPDESAHARYIKFIASHGRLPDWRFVGGGEAGYEGQHPPLYYAAGAAVYRLARGLPGNWRWQVLRWFTLALGTALIWIARGFFLDYFRGSFWPALAATAALGLTPLMLEYMSYINPDILSVLWCCLILWMSMRIARGEATVRDRIVLAASLGLGLLTKLTVIGTLPVIVMAHVWEPHPGAERPWERRRLLLLSTLLGAAAISAWWYLRNSLLYATPFVHTQGRVGSGLDLAAMTRGGLHLLQLTLTNTYITIWVERAWLPIGAVGWTVYTLISVMMISAIMAAVLRRLRPSAPRSAFDTAQWLCAIFIAGLVLFHQAQVWLVDYEFNAGGRYLLNGLVAVEALLVASFAGMRGSGFWFAAWVGLLIAINIISIHFMLTEVNPIVCPNWHVLKLTIPY
jgi:4-amino-4-deoxy-L-arabinose transferase-like glycosyltransferase